MGRAFGIVCRNAYHDAYYTRARGAMQGNRCLLGRDGAMIEEEGRGHGEDDVGRGASRSMIGAQGEEG